MTFQMQYINDTFIILFELKGFLNIKDMTESCITPENKSLKNYNFLFIVINSKAKYL